MEFLKDKFGLWAGGNFPEYSNLSPKLECEPKLFCSLIIRFGSAFLGKHLPKASETAFPANARFTNETRKCTRSGGRHALKSSEAALESPGFRFQRKA
jgi:hypothetical protein